MLMQNGTNFTQAEEKAAKFFRSCVVDINKRPANDYSNVVKFVNQFGGWPIVNDSWRDSEYNPWQVIAKMNDYSIKGRILGFGARPSPDTGRRTLIGVRISPP